MYVNPVTGKKERVEVVDGKCTLDDIALFAPLFNNGETPSHKRVGIPGTLHRLSLITHPAKRDAVIAVTARVGRAMEGVVARMVPFLLPSPPAAAAAAPLTRASTLPYTPFTFTSGTPSSSPGGPSLGGGAFASPSPREGPSPGGAFASWTSSSSAASSALAKAVADASEMSLLLIGRPGVGKTTLLRELAFALTSNPNLIVVVVDKVSLGSSRHVGRGRVM